MDLNSQIPMTDLKHFQDSLIHSTKNAERRDMFSPMQVNQNDHSKLLNQTQNVINDRKSISMAQVSFKDREKALLESPGWKHRKLKVEFKPFEKAV